MPRIQKVSTYLIWVFNAILILIPITSLILWTALDNAQVHTFLKPLVNNGILTYSNIKTPLGPIDLSKIHLTPFARSLGMLGDGIALLPFILGIIWVKRLFQNYRQNNIFSLENALLYKRLAWLFILDAILARPLSEAIHVLAVTFSNPPGQRYIAVGFGTPNLGVLLYGIVALVISWVMVEAYKLQEDKNLTI